VTLIFRHIEKNSFFRVLNSFVLFFSAENFL